MNIILIGRKHEGKSTFIRKYIKGKRCLLFDVNNEYKDMQTDTRKSVSRMTELDHMKFIRLCNEKRNTVCVFEDGTGFLGGRMESEFKKSFVSTRHTGNVNIYVFHSISAAPPMMLELADYIVLYRTNDERKRVEQKFPSLLSRYDKLQKASQFSYIVIKL